MEKAGVPRRQALAAATADAPTRRMQRLADDMAVQMRQGATLVEAMQRHPEFFDPTITSLIAVGEKTGRLAAVLQKCGEMLKRREAHDTGMRNATRNAKITFGVMVICSLIQNHDGLPYAAAFGIAGYVLATQGYKRVTAIRRIYDAIFLEIPKLGTLLAQHSMGIFSSSLATTYSSGIDLRRGLAIATATIPNLALKAEIEKVLPRVVAGEPMYKAFAAAPHVDRMVISMLRAGETSGNIAHTLNETAGYYERSTAAALTALEQWATPLLTIILGLILYSGL